MILYQRNNALFQRAIIGGSHVCLYNLVNCMYNCVLVCTSVFLIKFLSLCMTITSLYIQSYNYV